MEHLDGTVITTAVPAMAASFGAAPVDLNIGVSAYLLALGVFIPMSGWIADRFGPRLVFASAVVVFTLASLACGLANTLPVFVTLRILQGMGGAMMVPVGRLVVLNNTPKEDLIRAIALLTWPALVAPILGPPVGGLLTTYASWHWAFLINVPIVLVGVIAVTTARRADSIAVVPIALAVSVFCTVLLSWLVNGHPAIGTIGWVPRAMGLFSWALLALLLAAGSIIGRQLPLERVARLLAGPAVAVGLIYAAHLARRLGRIDDARVNEHYRVVGGTYGLGTSVPAGLSADDLVALMGRDKKVLSSGLTFVLDGAAGVEVVPGVDPAVALLALGDMAAHR